MRRNHASAILGIKVKKPVIKLSDHQTDLLYWASHSYISYLCFMLHWYINLLISNKFITYYGTVYTPFLNRTPQILCSFVLLHTCLIVQYIHTFTRALPPALQINLEMTLFWKSRSGPTTFTITSALKGYLVTSDSIRYTITSNSTKLRKLSIQLTVVQ